MNYVCQHIISKADQQRGDETNKAIKTHLFHDGSFLLIPAGSFKLSPTSETVNATYVFSRKDLSRREFLQASLSSCLCHCDFKFGIHIRHKVSCSSCSLSRSTLRCNNRYNMVT